MWRKIISNKKKLNQVQNVFNHIVYKAIKKCWQNFLKGIKETTNPTEIRYEDKN